MIKIHKLSWFKGFIECILRKNSTKVTWELIFFDCKEWELYSNQWEIYVKFIDEYEKKNGLTPKEEVIEWDIFDSEEHFAPALLCPSKEARTVISIIEKNIGDLELTKSFEERTSFLKKVINFNDADYLIIINEEFKSLFPCEHPLTIAHETIHIVDSYNPKRHSGEWIDGQAAKYTLKCMDKLEEGYRKELLKYDFSSGRYDCGDGVTIGLKSYEIPD